jgi:hypothetical protein
METKVIGSEPLANSRKRAKVHDGLQGLQKKEDVIITTITNVLPVVLS